MDGVAHVQFDWENIARFGYEAYGQDAGWKNYEGKPMPAWLDLPENVKRHWVAATREICDVFGKAVTP